MLLAGAWELCTGAGAVEIVPALFHFLYVFVRQPDSADEGFAFAEAVAIAAAGDEQMIFVRDLEVALGHGGGMLGVETFDAVQTGINQGGNDVVRAVQPRMSHDGQSPGLMDEFNGI